MFSSPVVYKNFINDDVRLHLKDYAYNLYENKLFQSNPFGPNRFHFMVDKYPNYFTKEIKDLFYSISNFIEIKDPVIDPVLGIIISIIKPGGFIHDHIDRYDISNPILRNKRNVRFNIMVERDKDVSYDPVIANKNYEVDIKDAWCFSASHMIHKTNKIVGNKDRLVYQFGFCV